MASKDSESLAAADAARALDPKKDEKICSDDQPYQSTMIDYGQLASMLVLFGIGGVILLVRYLFW